MVRTQNWIFQKNSNDNYRIIIKATEKIVTYEENASYQVKSWRREKRNISKIIGLTKKYLKVLLQN